MAKTKKTLFQSVGEDSAASLSIGWRPTETCKYLNISAWEARKVQGGAIEHISEAKANMDKTEEHIFQKLFY